AFSLLLLLATRVTAHELQSVSVRLAELSPGLVEVTLKTPFTRAGGSPAVVPALAGCEPVGDARVERSSRAILRRWRVRCAGGLAGRELRVDGLDPRTPGATVVASFAGGASTTTAVDRQDPSVRLEAAARAGAAPALLAFLPIGIEHILLGPDHL